MIKDWNISLHKGISQEKVTKRSSYTLRQRTEQGHYKNWASPQKKGRMDILWSGRLLSEGAAFTSHKEWLCSSCDNNLISSPYVWTQEYSFKTEAFSVGECVLWSDETSSNCLSTVPRGKYEPKMTLKQKLDPGFHMLTWNWGFCQSTNSWAVLTTKEFWPQTFRFLPESWFRGRI